MRKELNTVNISLRNQNPRIVSTPGEGCQIAGQDRKSYNNFKEELLDAYAGHL